MADVHSNIWLDSKDLITVNRASVDGRVWMNLGSNVTVFDRDYSDDGVSTLRRIYEALHEHFAPEATEKVG